LLTVKAEAGSVTDQQDIGDLGVHVVQVEVQAGACGDLGGGLVPDQAEPAGYGPEQRDKHDAQRYSHGYRGRGKRPDAARIAEAAEVARPGRRRVADRRVRCRQRAGRAGRPGRGGRHCAPPFRSVIVVHAPM
jgi:hypothetical protein